MIFLSILTLIVAIALPSIKQQLSSLMVTRISAIIFIYAGALSFNGLYIQSIGSGIGIYSGLFHVTVISQFLDGILFIFGAFILMAWPLISSSYYNKVLSLNVSPYTPRTEYCLIVLFSALGSSLLISSSDLLSMYLSIELQSFGLYILATLYREYESATASGLKYFLLGALSSCFILLGAGLIYNFTGLTNFESIYSLISVSWTNKIMSGVSLGVIFIFIGFLFKIAAAPFHSWSPDVYDETPTQVTLWLTVIPKLSILVLLLELQNGFGIEPIEGLISSESINTIFNVTYNTSYVLKLLLLISSLFSLIIGTVVGLAQTRIKRLLAYSTISHIGFILLALAINTEQSIDSFLFYIVQYSLTNLNMFLIIIALGYIIIRPRSPNFDFDIRYIKDMKGQFFANPLLSISLAICLFSFAGVPPLLGFFSKQFVLYSAVQSGYYFISIVAILASVISASYYLRIILLLFTGDSEAPEILSTNGGPNPLSHLHSFLISIFTLFILLFILKPTLLLNSTQLLALSLFNC